MIRSWSLMIFTKWRFLIEDVPQTYAEIFITMFVTNSSLSLSLSQSLTCYNSNIRPMTVQYRSLPIMVILGCPLFFLFPFRYDLLVLQIVPFLNRCCSGSIPIILCGMVSFISRVSLNASCALIFMPYRYVIKNEEDPILSTLL